MQMSLNLGATVSLTKKLDHSLLHARKDKKSVSFLFLAVTKLESTLQTPFSI